MKLTGRYSTLYSTLLQFIPSHRVLYDDLSTLTLGTDASFYKLIPKLIIRAENENEIVLITKTCSELNIPITFRAAGTSLSGQGVTDSVLVMIGSSWKKYFLNNEALKISLEPGLIGGHVNNILAPYKRKIGPDPASINSAMIGGIAANNAGGMCCGTAQNCYNTLSTMRIVFADGQILDTSDEKSKNNFTEKNSSFIKKIIGLRDKINFNTELRKKISRKYKIKNTTGYGLNSFIDFDDPFDIIQHLMIGSEGTLGFISEISLNTIPEHDFKASALIIFSSIEDACKAAIDLKSFPLDAAELMDRHSLRSVENKEGVPEYLKSLSNNAAALLIETRAENNTLLDNNIEQISAALRDFSPNAQFAFTKDKVEYTKLWNVRKGLFPSVGAARRSGTSVIIEDIAVAPIQLSSAVLRLQEILGKHHYNDAIIFGHALDGNLHFVFSQDFSIESEVFRYKSLIDDISDIIVNEFEGSLKAEHGTGRNMAPFVEYEWGEQAYSIMKEIKNIFDPKNILNPGVIINNDEHIHIKNLKVLSETSDYIDKCTECGFCESRCVSEGLTLSPRQRITALRELFRLKKSGKKAAYKSMYSLFKYSGDETCATDGLCSSNCPVDIDTGSAIKKFRSDHKSGLSKFTAKIISTNFSFVSGSIKLFLEVIYGISILIGESNTNRISKAVTQISGGKIPRWNKYVPRGNSRVKPLKHLDTTSLKVVYFPSCINRMMGTSVDYKNETYLTDKTVSLLQKAGYEVIYPSKINNLCCGMAFTSKGFSKAGEYKLNELMDELIIASNNGNFPVLTDMSPCFHRIRSIKNSSLHIFEPAKFILTFLKDKLRFEKTAKQIAVYPTCSTQQSGLTDHLRELAELCSSDVFMPEVNCCGFAGDKGFTHPELNTHGLMRYKESIPDNCKEGYSTSRTCEIGLTLNTGISFKSIIHLADDCTYPIVK